MVIFFFYGEGLIYCFFLDECRTSYAALVFRAAIQPGEFLLIHACAGGVGLAALQIGKALGAIVIATASTTEKLEVCKRYGADYLINYNEKEGGNGVWQKKVLEITKGKGVDVIYDPVGMIIPSLKCIAWNGRAIVVGFAGGNIEKVSLFLFHSFFAFSLSLSFS